MTFAELIAMTDAEREEIINSGLFNTMIQGYCILAMKQAGFSQKEVDRLDFVHLFDSVSAWEARQAAKDEQ